jgi:hypothetical protein
LVGEKDSRAPGFKGSSDMLRNYKESEVKLVVQVRRRTNYLFLSLTLFRSFNTDNPTPKEY